LKALIANSDLVNNYQDEILKSEKSIHSRKKISRKRAYWLSQFFGWSFFAFINIIVTAFLGELNWQRTIIALYMIQLGISFTHIYRAQIKKSNWLDLPLRKILPRTILASFIIGALIYGFILAIALSTNTYSSDEIKPISPFIGVFNMSSVVFVWSLIYLSLHYFENYKKVEIESLIWEAAVKDFELKTLKSQLNPHFMFNALNSIRALIEEDPSNAKDAVTRLSNILRYSLKIERTETVPLDEEMQTVKDYLALEKVRFEERLHYKLEVDQAVKNIEIPPMMIQTLVENAIKHGISKQPGGGSVTVAASMADNKVIIKINNTGHFDEELFRNSKGFGISNTKQRLNLLYGEDAYLNILALNKNEVLSELVIPTGGKK
jgi:sensor histidine kinase YesM